MNKENEFQSTHPHGVRRKRLTALMQNASFNPRTHTGCDIMFFLIFLKLEGFNPRTHTGCDYSYARYIYVPIVSIHAPTRGATTCAPFTLAATMSFNPRTHTGCDINILTKTNKTAVSIHAPTRGATRHTFGRYYQPRFNPRTHTGCDREGIQNGVFAYVSIHAPTRGAT